DAPRGRADRAGAAGGHDAAGGASARREHRPTRRIGPAATVFAFTPWLVFLAPAKALASPPPALPQLAALQPIVGTWKSDAVVSHCDWSPDRRWVVCDQKGTADGKPFEALSLYGYSPTRKDYVFFTIPEGNKTAWGATLRIEGKRW